MKKMSNEEFRIRAKIQEAKENNERVDESIFRDLCDELKINNIFGYYARLLNEGTGSGIDIINLAQKEIKKSKQDAVLDENMRILDWIKKERKRRKDYLVLEIFENKLHKHIDELKKLKGD